MTMLRMTPLDPSIEVSIGIVTYNRAALLDQCLRSIDVACQHISYEVLVADNASTDNTVELVRERHPNVALLPNARNMGLTRGVNQVLSRARGRHMLVLDSDTKIEPTAITDLLKFQRCHQEAGAVTPKLVYPDGTEQGAHKAFPTPLAALAGRRSLLRRLFPNNPLSRRYLLSAYTDTAESYEVDSASAACVLLRREVVEQAGGMDEDFFVYWSDVEWCRRIKEHGWKIWVVPTARVIHFESLSNAKQRPRAIIDFHKGAYLCYCKHQARSLFHPMRAVALVGLSLRAVLLLFFNAFKASPTPIQKQGTV